MEDKKRQYYAVLGLDVDAPKTEIKKAFRKLALKFHPDKNPDDPFFEKMFRDIKEAHDALIGSFDEEKRQPNNSTKSNSQTHKKKESNQNQKDSKNSQSSQYQGEQVMNDVISHLKNMSDEIRE